jgi:hypothetical protein
VWGSGGIAPLFSTSALDGGGWVVSFTPLTLLPRWHSRHYPLERRLGEPQTRSGRYGDEKNPLTLPEIEPRLLGRSVRSLVSIPTELYWLRIYFILYSFVTTAEITVYCHGFYFIYTKFRKLNSFPSSRVRRGKDSATAQAVSRRLPTAVAWVRSQVWSCGICGGQSGTGPGFRRVLRFPLPILIPPTVPQSWSPIIWGWYNRPNSGRSTKSHAMRRKNTVHPGGNTMVVWGGEAVKTGHLHY